ncbi:hypothetical protein PoB_000857700 [Plakobranchus ocellatus]|uniref:Secreted protein n=1 Tax=Plakobranchus ocellatus TaxID=259542 RepID=A0AAV3YIR0_9GAST|nr:hypothetical protein PoB_000857700 [Plakobranchus ocellatus]
MRCIISPVVFALALEVIFERRLPSLVTRRSLLQCFKVKGSLKSLSRASIHLIKLMYPLSQCDNSDIRRQLLYSTFLNESDSSSIPPTSALPDPSSACTNGWQSVTISSLESGLHSSCFLVTSLKHSVDFGDRLQSKLHVV